MTKPGEWNGGKLTRKSRQKIQEIVDSGLFADWWESVMERVCKGVNIVKIAEEEGMTIGVLSKFIKEDDSRRMDYYNAQKTWSDYLASDTIRISDGELIEAPDGSFVQSDPRVAKNQITARQWLASKLDRERFGDRVDVNISTTVDVRVAIEEAKSRALSRVTKAIDDLHRLEDKLGNDSPQVVDVLMVEQRESV